MRLLHRSNEINLTDMSEARYFRKAKEQNNRARELESKLRSLDDELKLKQDRIKKRNESLERCSEAFQSLKKIHKRIIAQLEEQKGFLKENIADLKNQVNDLKTDHDSLQTRIGEIEKTFEEIEVLLDKYKSLQVFMDLYEGRVPLGGIKYIFEVLFKILNVIEKNRIVIGEQLVNPSKFMRMMTGLYKTLSEEVKIEYRRP